MASSFSRGPWALSNCATKTTWNCTAADEVLVLVRLEVLAPPRPPAAPRAAHDLLAPGAGARATIDDVLTPRAGDPPLMRLGGAQDAPTAGVQSVADLVDLLLIDDPLRVRLVEAADGDRIYPRRPADGREVLRTGREICVFHRVRLRCKDSRAGHLR